LTDQPSEVLRVGLILDRFRAPRWVQQAIRAIQGVPEARIVLLLRVEVERPRRGGNPSRPGRWQHIAYDAFQRLDARLFRGHPDALEELDLGDLLSDCASLPIRAEQANHEVCLSDADQEAVRRHRLDVVVDFTSKGLKIRSGRISRLGVWSYRHGVSRNRTARPVGFREVVDGTEALFSALVADEGEGHPPRLLYESWSPVRRRSVHRTLVECLPKLAQFPARVLGDLRRRGGESPAAPGSSGSPVVAADSLPALPGNLEVTGAAAILAARYARDRLRRMVRRETWWLAYGFGKDPLSPRPDRTLPSAPGNFWADPFPVADEGGYWIFFEEAPLVGQVGHLSVMRMDPSGRCQAPTRVLKSETHLSYPGVFRAGNSWYLVPESSAARSVQLYRARRFPFEWELEEVLLGEVQAYDPTLAKIDDRWWMFVNIAAEGGSTLDELHLFHADRLQGPWKAHSRNPVKSDARSARPAGHIFGYRGSLYRPAQDCSIRYGRAVVLHRIVKIDLHEYVEVEASRILPDWDPLVVGVHTLNHAGGLTMMDCLYRERRWGRRSVESSLPQS